MTYAVTWHNKYTLTAKPSRDVTLSNATTNTVIFQRLNKANACFLGHRVCTRSRELSRLRRSGPSLTPFFSSRRPETGSEMYAWVRELGVIECGLRMSCPFYFWPYSVRKEEEGKRGREKRTTYITVTTLAFKNDKSRLITWCEGVFSEYFTAWFNFIAFLVSASFDLKDSNIRHS